MIEVTEEEVRTYVEKMCNGNIKGTAREKGVSESYLRNVVLGVYPPGPSVRQAFGVEKEVKYYLPEGAGGTQ